MMSLAECHIKVSLDGTHEGEEVARGDDSCRLLTQCTELPMALRLGAPKKGVGIYYI